jgi:hypothetical protein
MHTDKNMLLPGQTRHYSKKLNEAVTAVQEGLGRDIVFLSLEQRGDPKPRNGVSGYHDTYRGQERIWLDPGLPYTAQESTAAHELAHIIQRNEGYPRAFSIADSHGVPFIGELERLATLTNDLVMDESADLWAISRGFDMGKALKHIGLNAFISSLNKQAVEAEPGDWKTYFSGIQKLVQAFNHGKPGKPPFEIGPEVNTQAMALDYAGLSLRLARYDLFDGLESVWIKRWPVSRGMGKELAAIVKQNGVAGREQCRQSLEGIIAFLKIPAPLLGIH